MKTVVQRVREARVDVDGETVGAIGAGLLLLVGIGPADRPETFAWMAKKIAGLRIFADEQGRMNLSLREVGGSCLAVSQFTLFGDCRKGHRPGFTGAAAPEEAKRGFEAFVRELRDQNVPVETGIFQAEMQVSLVNDGPVTLILEKE